jgi:hypothetical protein
MRLCAALCLLALSVAGCASMPEPRAELRTDSACDSDCERDNRACVAHCATDADCRQACSHQFGECRHACAAQPY